MTASLHFSVHRLKPQANLTQDRLTSPAAIVNHLSRFLVHFRAKDNKA